MMNYYLPNNNISFFKIRRKFGLLDYYNHRKFKKLKYWKLAYTMWFFLFLAFTTRMGQIASFALGGRKQYTGLKVSLPEIRNTIYVTHHKNQLKIWIDRFGNVVINDKTIKNNHQLFDVLQEFYNNHAPTPVLYVDIDNKMEIVNKVISCINKSGYKNIIFASDFH